MEIGYRPMLLGLEVTVGLVGCGSWLVLSAQFSFNSCLLDACCVRGCSLLSVSSYTPCRRGLRVLWALPPLMLVVASISLAVDGSMRITIQLLLPGGNTVPKEYLRRGQRASFCCFVNGECFAVVSSLGKSTPCVPC